MIFMAKNKGIAVKSLLFLFIALIFLTTGCSTSKKLKMGNILRKTSWNIDSLSAQKFTLNPDIAKQFNSGNYISAGAEALFLIKAMSTGELDISMGMVDLQIHLRAKLPKGEALLIDSLRATLQADSLTPLPLVLSGTHTLSNEQSSLPVKTSVELNPEIFQWKNAKTVVISGNMYARFPEDDSSLELPFSVKRAISEHEKSKLMDNIRNEAINQLIGDWMKHLQ